MTFEPASSVLSDITVLDLTRVRAGPTCVRQLADWGANVIKIEMPVVTQEGQLGGPRAGSDFQNLHRNKRAMTLNLKTEAGVKIFKEMVKTADVVVENYRADVKFRLGIDYESLKPLNSRLIYGSISGFGQDGPLADRPGFDQIAQGMGGLMSITGAPGQGPMRVGIPVADLTAGIFCAQGILLALLERQKSGEGQWVQSSLLQAQVFMLDFQASRWLMDGEVAKQAGNNHPTSIPTGVFETSDGHINIASAGDVIYRRFVDVIGDQSMLAEEFATASARSKNRDKLNALISEHTRKKPSAEWIELLNKSGIPCGEIKSIDQVFESPQIKHLGMAKDMISHERGPTQVVGQPVTLSRTDSSVRHPPPTYSQHTDEILSELGYSTDDIAKLHDDGTV
ncbi:MAG: CoA transferase [Alphaproteobacteria bacterium]|nr:CoA transferase [Alphaproteobacteria bacterium]